MNKKMQPRTTLRAPIAAALRAPFTAALRAPFTNVRLIPLASAFFALLLVVGGCSPASTGMPNDSIPAVTQTVPKSTAGSTPSDDASSPLPTTSVELKDEDTDSSWDPATATAIKLEGTTASIEGGGAQTEGSTVTITAAGTYVVSGTLTKGSLVVKAGGDDLVRIVLNGASISAERNAALYAASADKLVVILADGSRNTLTDTATYDFADAEKEEPDAALFSKCDLSINGSGSLKVTGSFTHGIATKDDLVVTGGSITIDAVSDALRGKDSVTITGGSFTLTSKDGDGVKASNDTEADKGWVIIQDGDFSLTTGDDAIHAETSLSMSGGEVTILSCYEGLEASTISISGGMVDIRQARDDAINAAGTGSLRVDISGGSVKALASSDCLDSNGTATISGGTVQLFSNATRDGDAMDTQGLLTINGGTVVYGGLLSAGSVPTGASTQGYVYVSAELTSGDSLELRQDGKVVTAFSAYSDSRVLVFSSPTIVNGEVYEVYRGGALITEVTAGTGGGIAGMGSQGGRGGMGGQGSPGAVNPGADGTQPPGTGAPGGMRGGRTV